MQPQEELWAYGGNRTINNSLYIGGSFALGARRDEAVAGDTTLLAAANDPYDLSFSSTGKVVLNTSTTLTVNDPNGPAGLAGTIGDNVALSAAGNTLTKAGVGDLVLAGNSVYTGTTTVNAGRVRIITNASAIGAPRNEVQRLTLQILPLITGTFGLSFTAPAAFGGLVFNTATTFDSTLTAARWPQLSPMPPITTCSRIVRRSPTMGSFVASTCASRVPA